MRVKANAIAAIFLGVSLSACAGQAFTERVTEVRTSYATTWDGRMAAYQSTLSDAEVPVTIAIDPKSKATAAPESRDLSAIEDGQAALLGRFDTMVAFKAFRHTEPVMSVALKWLREHWAVQVGALRQAGLSDDQLSELLAQIVSDPPDLPTTGDSQSRYRVGAMVETRLLAEELAQFNTSYHTALRIDLANRPEQAPPMSASQLQGIINATSAGARIGAGLGR